MGIKSVTLSFDDGVQQDIRFVELLNKYGIKCTFNLNSGKATELGSWVYHGLNVVHINLTELRDLYRGHEIASHSLTHPILTGLNERTIYNEIYSDKKILENFFETEVVGFAYPCGNYDDLIVQIAEKCGIRYARTIIDNFEFAPQKDLMRFKPTCHYNHPDIFKIIDRFIETESDQKQVLYIWGHSYELEADNTWERFEEVCKRLVKEKEIIFETNSGALLGDGTKGEVK